MAQRDITPILEQLRSRGYIIIGLIELSDRSGEDITTTSNGRFTTKQQAITELIAIARQIYRLVENCEDGEIAIQAIFGNWIP